jgi:hypothetical protein
MYHQRNRSKTILHVLAALLLSAALSTTASAQTNVAFSDGTFSANPSAAMPVTDWTSMVAGAASGDARYAITLTYEASGGYPGAWLKEEFSLYGTNALVVWFVSNPANTFTGTFASLNYSYDLQNPGPEIDVGHEIAIEQNGTVYIPFNPDVEDGLATDKTAWADEPNPWFHRGLTASQFCAVPSNMSDSVPPNCALNPSFNTTQTTVFGYTVGTSWLGGPKGTTEVTGIDNWCVVLVGASGPGGSGPGCDGVSNLGTGNTTSVN